MFIVANLILIWLFVLFESAGAGEDRQYRGVRPMGMGNAFAAIADDGDAFYYNPAGLVAAKGIRFDLQPIKLMPTQGFYNEFKDMDQLMDDIEAINESAEPLEDPDLKDERLRLMQRMKRLLRENLGLDMGAPVRFIVPLHIGNYGVAIGGMAHAWSGSQVYVQRRGLRWSDFVKDMLDDEVLYNIMAETSYSGAAAIEIPISTLPFELSFGSCCQKNTSLADDR